MKIVFAPTLLCRALTDECRRRILDAAGPGARLVEANDTARQREEIVQSGLLFSSGYCMVTFLRKMCEKVSAMPLSVARR